ncbi:protein SIEL-like [Zingiber officinale]|uniref:protein SIEL-like n=1 Tax=Zingiber officinale TaxID=94328 RepID=UPI001C4AB107|nr:protein SIEL-like [Zingiber officinale]
MDLALLARLQNQLSSSSADSPRCLRALSLARSLLTHPDSTENTRRSIVDILIGSLRHRADDSTILRLKLKILGDAAMLSREFASAVVAAVRPFLDSCDNLAADALATLVSAAEAHALCADREAGDKGGGELPLIASVLNGDILISLASSPIAAVRSGILDLLVRSVEGMRGDLFRRHLVIRIFRSLVMDLYPLVRRRAVDGMIALLRYAGGGIDSLDVEHFFDRAVELLKDEAEVVRLVAVRLISECGEIFTASQQGAEHSDQMTMIFVQLGSMARDMCVEVRYEAFIALGRVRLVQENVLLQSLSKKILRAKSGSHVESSVNGTKISLQSAAGIFVHGIEDEFYKVREAACRSMGKLSISSAQFANEAINLLMDMLNDDTEVVQLQTLQTLCHMATCNSLIIQSKHTQMFLWLLSDINASIRCKARKLLQLVKLPDLVTFTKAIDSLITNLETFPEEEKDIFFVLFFLGKNHKKFSTKVAKEFAKKTDLSCGELILDSPGAAAKLVLIISSSFFNEQRTTDIPAVLFSYAVPLCGRIASALRGAISQDSLVAYLCSQSKEVNKLYSSAGPVDFTMFDFAFKGNTLDFSEIVTFPEQLQDSSELLNDEIMHSIKLNLKTIGEAWPLIKSHQLHKVRSLLRDCKEELETIALDVDQSACGFLDFVSLYIEAIHLIAEVWERCLSTGSHFMGMTALDIKLEKLDSNLKRLRNAFCDLQSDEECHVLELTLLSYAFRLTEIGVHPEPIFAELKSIILRLEFLCEGSSNLSAFAKEVRRVCNGCTTDTDFHPHVFRKMVELFYPQKVTYSGRFKQKKAEVRVIGNDSENPLTFIPGLPVGIPFHITIYEVLNNDRLWILMEMGKSINYVFLDLSQFKGSEAKRNQTLHVPFYGTPKAPSFSLKVYIAMECPDDPTNQKRGQGGPINNLAIISIENSVYFVNVSNK